MKSNKFFTLPATRQKSYYGKAKYRFDGDKIILTSYDTDVIAIDRNTGIIYRLWSGYSVTSMKHINDFLYMVNGESLSKRDWLDLPVVDPQPVYNVYISTGFTTHKCPALLTAEECENTIEKITNPRLTVWYE